MLNLITILVHECRCRPGLLPERNGSSVRVTNCVYLFNYSDYFSQKARPLWLNGQPRRLNQSKLFFFLHEVRSKIAASYLAQ